MKLDLANNSLIRRELLSQLKNHLERKQISLIVGPRQAGKTTLMKLLQEELTNRGRETIYLNLEQDQEIFSSQEKLIDFLDLETSSDRPVVFIDEIQRKENAGIFLKAIYDRDLPYKFVVSGSGSLELKADIHESLVGRKRVFNLSTTTFLEFVNYSTNYQYQNKLEKFFEIKQQQAHNLLERYLNFGGYPRVVTAESRVEKRREMDEIFQSYLQKDVSSLLKVKKLDAFANLFGVLSEQLGCTAKYSQLAKQLGISQTTVKNYLYYAEKTFIIDRLNPFFTNQQKEIVKSPKIYFHDLGLRNYSLELFGKLNSKQRLSKAFENLVYRILRQKTEISAYSIKYWRTQHQAEVDFILSPNKKKTIPIEVKYKKMKEPKVSRSFRSFLKEYSPKRAYLVNLTLSKTIEIEKTKVNFIPIYELLFADIL